MTERSNKDIIKDMREIIKPFISDCLKRVNYEGKGDADKAEFETEFEKVLTLAEKAETLSKNKGDLISREFLKTAIHNFFNGLNHAPTEEDIQRYIEVAPSADVRPNIHGHWKPVDPLQSGDNERYGTYICSVCGTGTYGIVPARWKGCPWCLAIMNVEPKGEKGET